MKSSFGRKRPPLSFVLKVRGSPEVDAFLSEPLRGPVISLLTVHFYLCGMCQNGTKTELSEWTL